MIEIGLFTKIRPSITFIMVIGQSLKPFNSVLEELNCYRSRIGGETDGCIISALFALSWLWTLMFSGGCGGDLTFDSPHVLFKYVSHHGKRAYLLGSPEVLSVKVAYYTSYEEPADYRIWFEGRHKNQVKFADTVYLYGLEWSKDDRYVDLRWQGGCGSVPQGYYELYVYFEMLTKQRQRVSSMSDDSVAIVDTSLGVNFIKWCGDMRHGVTNDSIRFPVGYPIFVRAVSTFDPMVGINGLPVEFSCIPGSLWVEWDRTTDDGLRWAPCYPGMAEAYLILSDVLVIMR